MELERPTSRPAFASVRSGLRGASPVTETSTACSRSGRTHLEPRRSHVGAHPLANDAGSPCSASRRAHTPRCSDLGRRRSLERREATIGRAVPGRRLARLRADEEMQLLVAAERDVRQRAHLGGLLHDADDPERRTPAAPQRQRWTPTRSAPRPAAAEGCALERRMIVDPAKPTCQLDVGPPVGERSGQTRPRRGPFEDPQRVFAENVSHVGMEPLS